MSAVVMDRSRAIPAIDLAELADDWLTTEEAADLLVVDSSSMLKAMRMDQTVRHVRARDPAPVQGFRYLWWRRDVEDLARLRKRFHISLNVALRIMAVERPRPPSPSITKGQQEPRCGGALASIGEPASRHAKFG